MRLGKPTLTAANDTNDMSLRSQIPTPTASPAPTLGPSSSAVLPSGNSSNAVLMLGSDSADMVEAHRRSAYHYQRLPAGNSFRLLKLLPNEALEADIVCHLTTWDLDFPQCPTYSAISYTWGSGDTRATISIEAGRTTGGELSGSVKTLAVRENVLDLLRHLRQRTTHRCVWIDALCIDQDWTEERNHQVQLMGRIYREANIVVVWLGFVDGDQSDITLPGLQKDNSQMKLRHHKMVSEAFDILETVYDQKLASFGLTSYLKPRYDSNANLHAMVRFLKMRYWTRKWVRTLMSGRLFWDS